MRICQMNRRFFACIAGNWEVITVKVFQKQTVYKTVACLFTVIVAVTALTAQSENFKKGEDLFRQDEPEQAIPFLKKAINEGNPTAYIYLSIAYYQTGKFQEGLNICNAGMQAQGTDKKVLAYNAGNIEFATGDYAGAELWFSKAIVADPQYAEPVLNRANALLNQKKYRDSRNDYIHYLELAPDDPQQEQIRILIKLLEEQVAADEQAEADRIAEQKRLKEEADRIAAQEAERKRKLLEDVEKSLKNTDTENMTAGAEGTVDYGYESEIE